MNDSQAILIQDEERQKKVVEIIHKAAKETHTVLINAQNKSKAAWDAIATHDKEVMWRTLQKFYREYGNFIDRMSSITGIRLYYVGPDYYDKVTESEIEKQTSLDNGKHTIV